MPYTSYYISMFCSPINLVDALINSDNKKDDNKKNFIITIFIHDFMLYPLIDMFLLYPAIYRNI